MLHAARPLPAWLVFEVRQGPLVEEMKVFCIIVLFLSGALAGLSILALPLWAMGVPGVDNSYAKGWKIGLYAVLLYPVGWLGVFAYWLRVRKQLSAEELSALNLSVSVGVLALMAVALGVIFYAFKVMSRP